MHNLAKSAKRSRIIKQSILIIVLTIFLVLSFLPIYYLLIKSFKDPDQETLKPYAITFPLCFDNYKIAWLFVKDYILNTIFIALIQTSGTLVVCSLASFAFVRYKFPIKKVLFMFILSFMMVPGILTLIPQYRLVVTKLHLANTYLGVVLPAITGAIPMGIFLLNTFFHGIPKELFEAAEIDGANKIQQYFALVLPLSVPILSTLALMQVMSAWNDLLWPTLILQDERMHTISVGLQPFTTAYINEYLSYGVPFAGYVIVSLPLLIIFFFTSKQFIKGLTSGAFKM